MLVSLTVEDVMSTPVETTTPGVSAADAARQLRETTVGSIVVCEDERPVGIVTESDMVSILARGVDGESITVREAMTAELVTVTPDVALEDAARLLSEHDIRRLPVCADEEGAKRLVGIVTSTDLSYYLPHLARHPTGWSSRVERGPPTTDSTSYDDPDWGFEHVGDGELSVGDVVRFRKTLSEVDIERFAEASGDTNRIHLDDEFAAKTRFGGRIAHGILTAGLISAALARLPGLTIYLSQDLRFLGPVEVDDELTAVCEVIEDLGKNKFEVATTIYDSDGEVVIDGEAVVLMTELPAEDEDEAADRDHQEAAIDSQ